MILFINDYFFCGIRNSSISLERVGALTHIDKNIDSFNLIMPNHLPLKDKTVIVNLISPLNVRKERNAKRYENGGHFVSEDTMDNVYDKDYFSYIETASSIGYIEIKKQKYPAITICNDKSLSPVELNSFLYYNLERIIIQK